MTHPSLCTAQINQTVVSDSKKQVCFSNILHWYPTACAAVYQCYLCIFLIAETDMIAAHFIQYKMQADCFLNPPLVTFKCTVESICTLDLCSNLNLNKKEKLTWWICISDSFSLWPYRLYSFRCPQHTCIHDLNKTGIDHNYISRLYLI